MTNRARAIGERIESPRAYLLARRCFAAAEEGDLRGLQELLAYDVVLHGDGILLDVADGQIQAVNSSVNPDKLRHLGPVADVKSLRRSTR